MISRQQRRKASYTAFVVIAIIVGFGRWFLETNLGIAKVNGLLPFAYAFYYIVVGFSFYLILRYVAGISPRYSLNSARLGLLVGFLPPLIDLAYASVANKPIQNYSYYLYEDFRFFSAFFYDPHHGFPFGESVAVWLIILMTLVLTFRETRNPLRLVGSVLAGYGVFLFFLILLPKGMADYFTTDIPLVDLDAKGRLTSRNLTTQYHVYIHFAIIILLLFFADPHFRASVRKRLFHYLPFGAIAAAPFVFAKNYSIAALCIPLLVMLNFLFACMQNDQYDSDSRGKGKFATYRAGSAQNADVVKFLMILLLLLIAYLYGLGNLLFFPQLSFFLLTLLYNLPEARMRYYLLGGQKIEGGWGVCALWSALVCFKMNPFQISTLLFTALVFFGWAYISSIKDLKDLLDDNHAGRTTMFTFLRKKLRTLSRGVVVYKFQVAILIASPILYIGSHKSIFSSLLFFSCAILPIWFVLYYARRRRIFKYFSASISVYFLLFAYLAGY